MNVVELTTKEEKDQLHADDDREHIFRLVDLLMNRTEAQAYCMAMDTRYGLPSHLASVQNDDENALVLELCQASEFPVQKCWLGFSSSAADDASAPWAWDSVVLQ